MRGLHVAFEGCDGAGKSTLRRLAFEALDAGGCPVVPVGRFSWLDIPAALQIMDLIERGRTDEPDVALDAYRRDLDALVARVLVPALRAGHVIQDRSILSEVIYNEALFGVPAAETLQRRRDSRAWPDLIINIRVDPDVAYERLVRRGYGLEDHETPAVLSRIVETSERVLRDYAAELPEVVTLENSGDHIPGEFDHELLPRLSEAFNRRARFGKSSVAPGHPAGMSSDGGVAPALLQACEAIIAGRIAVQYLYLVEKESAPGGCLAAEPAPRLVEAGGFDTYLTLVSAHMSPWDAYDDDVVFMSDLVAEVGRMVFRLVLRAESSACASAQAGTGSHLEHLMGICAAYRWAGSLLRDARGMLSAADLATLDQMRMAHRDEIERRRDDVDAILSQMEPLPRTHDVIRLNWPLYHWLPTLMRRPGTG